jgi:hypothetical protein
MEMNITVKQVDQQEEVVTKFEEISMEMTIEERLMFKSR